MNSQVAIIDYQMGNLRSVQKAIEKVGGHAVVTDDATTIRNASHVILPGVGAFGDAMRELNTRHLVPVIREVIQSGKPFLGICLGMQLLFDSSEESEGIAGIGAVSGQVRRFQIDPSLKVPHMGWNCVRSIQPNNPLLGSSAEPYMYFVHSYYCQPAEQDWTWLECDYGGAFCAAIAKGNVFATQFHPEKSQQLGLELLTRFLKVAVDNAQRTGSLQVN
jgi:imidazole glycerol-phosphate synthase subunit HisH